MASPTINTQPLQQSVASGSTATFSVSATTSGGALSYQWKKRASSTPYVGASAIVLTPTNTTSTTPAVTTQTSGSTFLVYSHAASLTGVSDNKGNTYTQITNTTGSVMTTPLYIYECVNGTGGTGHTATTTYSLASNKLTVFVEIIGSGGRDALVQTSDITPSPYSITTGPPANSAELAVIFTSVDGVANPVAFVERTGYRIYQFNPDNAAYDAMFIAASSRSDTAVRSSSWTGSGSTYAQAALFTYYSASENISGATSSSYTTPTLSNADNGTQYWCAVTDSNGTTNTGLAGLYIIGESSGDGDKINSAWFTR